MGATAGPMGTQGSASEAENVAFVMMKNDRCSQKDDQCPRAGESGIQGSPLAPGVGETKISGEVCSVRVGVCSSDPCHCEGLRGWGEKCLRRRS